jgi:hypothetical protein
MESNLKTQAATLQTFGGCGTPAACGQAVLGVSLFALDGRERLLSFGILLVDHGAVGRADELPNPRDAQEES